jgi:hypothetical protein
MTIEALSLTLCLVSGIFGRPAWDTEKCTERAEQILSIATSHNIDPLLMVAVNVQECDMRENVDAMVYQGTGKKRKVIGRDACPMGIRLMGEAAKRKYEPKELYEMAAQKMERWKNWCEKGHQGQLYKGLKGDKHHFIYHYNQGNPIYAAQVLSILATIKGKSLNEKYEQDLTPRSKEIIRRLLRSLNDLRS